MSTTTTHHRERPGRSRSQEAADRALADVLELFRDPERLPAAVAQTLLVRQAGEAPMSAWSLPNQLLCVLADTDDARGIRQWNAVGRRVKRGARALRILAPRTRKIDDTDDDGNDRERFVTVGFVAVPVFRYADTEGAEIDRPDYRPDAFPPLYDVAARLGVTVAYEAARTDFASVATGRGGYRGSYEPETDRIVLATHDVRTFFHELAHAAHARVLRARGESLEAGQVNEQEVVAEVTAAALCHLHGFDGYLGHSAGYVDRYSEGKGSARAACRALGEVQEVLALILGDARPSSDA